MGFRSDSSVSSKWDGGFEGCLFAPEEGGQSQCRYGESGGGFHRVVKENLSRSVNNCMHSRFAGLRALVRVVGGLVERTVRTRDSSGKRVAGSRVPRQLDVVNL